jgi:glycosyltransferase involved in cell wall biosynthesis
MKVCFVIRRLDFFVSHRFDLALSLAKTHEVCVITSCLNAPKEEVQRIQALGISIHHLASRSGSLNLISYLKYVLSLKRIIHEIKPNFLFYVTLEMSVFGALLHNFISIKKSFFLITGLDTFFFDKKLKYILYRAIQKSFFLLLRLRSNYHFIFQNSDDMTTFITNKLVVRNHASIIQGSGIDINQFSFQPRNTSNKLTFLFASRLTRPKGIIEYFEASRDLASKYPDVEFHIAGRFDLTDPNSITQS